MNAKTSNRHTKVSILALKPKPLAPSVDLTLYVFVLLADRVHSASIDQLSAVAVELSQLDVLDCGAACLHVQEKLF